MTSLEPWIEAQLKRGYTRKQVKDALIRKGYSSAAAAEVDKVGYSALPAKTLPSNKIPNKFSYKAIALAGIIIVIVVVVVLNYVLQGGNKQIQAAQSINPLCKDFPTVAGEVSCDEAVKLATEKYSGKVYSVNRIGTEKERKIWIVGINLNTPLTVELKGGGSKNINIVEVSVDENRGIGIYKMSG